MATERPEWYRKTADEALSALSTSLHKGLSHEEATRRRGDSGPNVIRDARRRSPFRILVSQFSDLLVLVLIGAAFVAGLVGEPQDVVAIVVIVVVNAILGFVQEYRAERAIEALKSLASPQAAVKRMGKLLSVPAFDLVPGDIVLLEAGNLVPADLRLLESFELKIDESALTGESHPVEKSFAALASPRLAVGDRTNMAFKGTLVTSGRATGVVTDTGMRTELGKIAELLHEEVEVKTPLQNRLGALAKRLALVVLFLCAIVFITGLTRGEKPGLMFMTALSLAVAAIPESLPAVVTVALALSARTLGRKNALVRKLPAVEALGSVTFICTDKTGTLTENRMQVVQLQPFGSTTAEAGPPGRLFLQMLAQSNDATFDERGDLRGDPTETALLRAAQEAGLDLAALEDEFPRIAELPFSSERAMMSTIHRGADGGVLVFVKGAPERVLARCTEGLSASGPRPLDRDEALKVSEQMAADGLRVLAFAVKNVREPFTLSDPESIERDLTFVGFAGLMDPPRAEAKDAIRLCQNAGIHVIMITGDHPVTAKTIARQLGLFVDQREGVMTGAQLEAIDERELLQRVRETAVFARVAPEQKIRLVKALQSLGEVAAMTGDGVNDAPALRRANIGVSMGRGGTDVAREASHMILLDDNFATIVKAVREGRRIYDNIRKFVRFALSGNSGEIWPLFLAPLLGLPTPLLPIQILWVNLVTDGLPGVSLALEVEERTLMKRPPRSPQEGIFAQGLWQHVLWVGLLTGAVTLTTQAIAIHFGSPHWQTMCFTVLTFTQMGHVMAIRSERDSLFTIGIASNPLLLGAVLLTFALQLALLYVPALNNVFQTQPLTAPELAFCLVISSSVFVAVEIEKWLRRRSQDF